MCYFSQKHLSYIETQNEFLNYILSKCESWRNDHGEGAAEAQLLTVDTLLSSSTLDQELCSDTTRKHPSEHWLFSSVTVCEIHNEISLTVPVVPQHILTCCWWWSPQSPGHPLLHSKVSHSHWKIWGRRIQNKIGETVLKWDYETFETRLNTFFLLQMKSWIYNQEDEPLLNSYMSIFSHYVVISK